MRIKFSSCVITEYICLVTSYRTSFSKFTPKCSLFSYILSLWVVVVVAYLWKFRFQTVALSGRIATTPVAFWPHPLPVLLVYERADGRASAYFLLSFVPPGPYIILTFGLLIAGGIEHVYLCREKKSKFAREMSHFYGWVILVWIS